MDKFMNISSDTYFYAVMNANLSKLKVSASEMKKCLSALCYFHGGIKINCNGKPMSIDILKKQSASDPLKNRFFLPSVHFLTA